VNRAEVVAAARAKADQLEQTIAEIDADLGCTDWEERPRLLRMVATDRQLADRLDRR
jgi:hypothetical protein